MRGQDQETEFITAGEARKRLDVSKGKMAQWLRDGTLPSVSSPFNMRAKLVRVTDVERLAEEPRTVKPDLWEDLMRTVRDDPRLSEETKTYEIQRVLEQRDRVRAAHQVAMLREEHGS